MRTAIIVLVAIYFEYILGITHLKSGLAIFFALGVILTLLQDALVIIKDAKELYKK
jgi:hypothetical protein